MQTDISIFRKNILFKRISEETLIELFQQLNPQKLNFNKNDLIVQAGTSCDYLLLVCTGSVRGEMLNNKGKTLKVEDIGSGKPLAPAFLFGEESKFPVSIYANEECIICRLWKDDVIKLMQLNQEFLNNYLNLICNRTQFLSQKVRFLSFNTIKEKLASFILSQLHKDQIAIEINKTQQQLADLFGVSRPALARVIGDLEEEGLLKVSGKKYEILNIERLRKSLED
jgi:CRP-like cAMP-binding protein